MIITDVQKNLIIAGYIAGYESGHHDTVESAYTDAEESARDWLNDALEDGGLEYTFTELLVKSKVIIAI